MIPETEQKFRCNRCETHLTSSTSHVGWGFELCNTCFAQFEEELEEDRMNELELEGRMELVEFYEDVFGQYEN
jgi:hypothetical protein